MDTKLSNSADQIATTFEYMDSLSQAGSRSSRATSVASGASSASNARLRASAEKAALQAEIATGNRRQALEEEELKLRQRRRQIELETKLARAAAIEKTFAEAENDYDVKNSTPLVQPVTTHHTTPNQVPKVNQDDSLPSSGSTTIPSLSTPVGDTPSNFTHLVKAMQVQQQSLVETLQLPKTELMTFDGDPANYWVFIRAFENAVEKDTISDAAKLARLQQYCTGAAKKLIQCCAVKTPPEGYALARKLLKERFGNEYDIAEAWINKIVNRPDIRDSRALLDFADDLRNCRETLDTMDKLCELNNSRSLAQMLDKLPWDVRKAWLRKVYHIKTVESRSPTIDDVVNFVQISAQQANDPVYSKLVSRDRAEKSMKDVKRKDTSVSKPRSNFVTQVETASSPQRTNDKGTYRNADWHANASSERLCVNCLQPGHRARDCSRDAVCTVPGCGLKHTKFLHLTRTGNPSTPTSVYPVKQGDQLINNAVPVTVNAVPTTASANATCNTSGAGSGRIALPIVPVKVRSHRSATNFVTTYALLDSGSTQTFCSEKLINELGVNGKPDTMRLTTLDNHDILTETRIVHLEVTDMCDENLVVMTHVLTRPKLQMGISTLIDQKEINKWSHLSDIILPDVDANNVHLLIGQDNPSALIPKEVREGGVGTPYATRTKLGWTLNGPFETGPLSRSTSFFIETDTSLQQQVEKFWKLDGTGGDERGMSISDKKVISTWEQSLCRDGAHYSMNIPFKMRPPQLPDNKAVAEHRLRLLGRRLGRDSDMKEKYIAGIQDLMNKGYAEEVPQQDLNREDGAVWYLPHHPVLHPRKPGKVRIVFDCAARYRGVSLNDKVHQGPDMTNKLVGVLIQFRQETIALMADVEGMFHQVHVNKPDRDVLRFLWWTDNDISGVPTKTFRMTSHLFGGIWSPSCATFALKRTAQDNMESFDANTIDTIDKNFYVDDCLKSVATEQEAISLVRQLREVLASGGFRLTKWISNSREVLRSVPESERAKGVPTLDLDQTLPAERALGVLWDIESDAFTFNVSVTEKPLTRRGLLGTVSSVYDPLGYASPFVLTAKILFQSLCRMKIGWDDPIPDSIKEQWIRWMADLPLLQKISIPRCVKPLNYDTITSAQLHHFADASERGFGAVTYLRLQDSSGLVHCVLLMAKAKLAPLKTTTIPRLELAAAVISVKLDETMRRHLTLPLQETVYWSDSMIVLQYLRNEEKRFQTFVANRVSKILEHSTPQQWKHVDTSSNPADDVSRGLQAQQLIDSKRWLHGPQFLQLEEDKWPNQPEFDKMTLPVDMELKTVTQVYSVEATTNTP
ncbi:uncharacterized protein LOC117302547 [Asterias rubens]|uniref:uncharacterized protein LOC117302547 n=1 Tax=Asterias rubens TaxID=7604 RepID=UPI001455783D|nr:uncharacterized protein LOC117302547 [Asterias rubens]